jgi:hypothetical protein
LFIVETPTTFEESTMSASASAPVSASASASASAHGSSESGIEIYPSVNSESPASLRRRVLGILEMYEHLMHNFAAHSVKLGTTKCECGADCAIGATNVPNPKECFGEGTKHALLPMCAGFYNATLFSSGAVLFENGSTRPFQSGPVTDPKTYHKICVTKFMMHYVSGGTECDCYTLMPCATYLNLETLPPPEICQKILSVKFTNADRADQCGCGLVKKVWTDKRHHKNKCDMFE